MRILYLFLFAIGTVVPYWEFVPFLWEHGLDVPLLLEQLFASRISAFFGWDVIISAVVLFAWMVAERKRSVPHRWTAVLATCTIGVSAGLPLYLFLREGGRKK